LVSFWPYPQTLAQAGKTCQGQTLKLITNICKLRTKRFYNIGSRYQDVLTIVTTLGDEEKLQVLNLYFSNLSRVAVRQMNPTLENENVNNCLSTLNYILLKDICGL
jgi:hypothetical protein